MVPHSLTNFLLDLDESQNWSLRQVEDASPGAAEQKIGEGLKGSEGETRITGRGRVLLGANPRKAVISF